MKKVIAALLCICMAAGLIGCRSGTAAPEETENSAESSTEDSAEGDAETEQAQEEAASNTTSKTTITLLSWYTEEQLKALKDGFEASNPDLELEIQYVPPTEQYTEKVMLLMNGDEPTDLFFYGPDFGEAIDETNFAEDLSSLPIMEKLSGNAKRTMSIGDKIYAVSLDSWAGCMFYNTELFEQAGITQIPQTWDELVEAMGKLNDLGVEPLVAQAEDAGRLLLGLFAANEISKDPEAEYGLADGSKTFSELYGPSMEAWYEDVVKPGYIRQSCLSLTSDQAEEMFANGKAAMLLGGPWNIPNFVQKNPEATFDAFAVPGFEGNPTLQGGANVGIGVTTGAAHKEEAYRFMDYLTSEEGLAIWATVLGNFMNVPGVEYEVHPCLEKFKDAVANDELYWQTVVWPDSASVLNEFTTSCQNVIAGIYTPEEALESIDAKIADLISQ